MSYCDIGTLPPPLRTLVESELQAGERIAWMEQPIPGRVTRGSIPMVLFGIPWTAFAVFWTVMAGWGTSHSGLWFLNFFPLFGLPFIVIGIGMLSSPYWMRRAATRSVYVLTNRRAIIFKAGWRGTVDVRSFEPQSLTDLERKQNTDGSGDLIFARDVRRDSDGDRRTTTIGFLAISEVKSVEDRVRALAQQGGSRSI